MLVLGIVGGVASGKSLVAAELGRCGAGVVRADEIGHAVLRLPAIERAVRRRFGDGVLGADGQVDRTALAAKVFAPGEAGAAARTYLQQLTHPEIARRARKELEALARAGCPAAALDAALLVEAGWDAWCDNVIFVDAPRELRLARARCRGWCEEDFAARESAQESLDFKRQHADWVVDNSGSPEQVRSQVERIWSALLG